MLSFKSFCISEARDWEAQEGESEVLHHATPYKFNNFRPLSHFGTKQAARQIALHRTWQDTPHIYTKAVRLKLGNTVEINDDDITHSPFDIARALQDKKHLDYNDVDSIQATRENHGSGAAALHLSKLLRSKNIHSISYKNTVEDKGSMSYIITHPSQVRVLRSGIIKSKSLYNLSNRIYRDQKNKKSNISESSSNYYMIHGGSDFDEIDPRKYGTGEPGNIRPLGKGLYGYALDPTNRPEDMHGAIEWAKRYSTKYGGPNKKLHIFKIDNSTKTSYNGYHKHLDLPGPDENGNFQMRTSRLPIDQTEIAVHDPSVLTRVGKFDLDTPNEHIIKSIK